mgnify:CR=1 FL=1
MNKRIKTTTGKHQTEQEREITGTHLGGCPHGVAARDEGKAQTDQDEHQAGGKVLLAAYAQNDSPQSCEKRYCVARRL